MSALSASFEISNPMGICIEVRNAAGKSGSIQTRSGGGAGVGVGVVEAVMVGEMVLLGVGSTVFSTGEAGLAITEQPERINAKPISGTHFKRNKKGNTDSPVIADILSASFSRKLYFTPSTTVSQAA